MQTILISRKFWAALIGLVLIVLTAFLPGLPDLSTPLVELAGLLSAYMIGSALEANPLPAGQVLRGMLKSRKFWATTAGLLVVIVRAVCPSFPITDEQISALVLTLSAYTFGTGLQDSLTVKQEQSHA